MSALYRLRITVDAGSGALARVGRAVEQLGGTIVTVDLQHGGEKRGICDATVRLLEDVAKLDVLSDAFSAADAGVLNTVDSVEDSVDPVLRAIRWACSIVGAGSLADDEMRRVIGEICSTGDAWFVTVEEAKALGVADLAIERSEPTVTHVATVPKALEASFCGAADILAVPDARLEPTEFAIVVKHANELFSTTEIDRVEAMLALRRRAALLRPYVADAATSPWFDVSSQPT